MADEEDYDGEDYPATSVVVARDSEPWYSVECQRHRKLPYGVGMIIIVLWVFTLIGAAVWLDIKWHIRWVWLGYVGFGLFWLGVFLVATVTKDYSE